MPASMPSICAIIPTYNRAQYIREAIDSVLFQSRALQQIIVVNDGSTDETENIVKSYGEKILLISKENGGKSTAINLALSQCTSDYIWIFDDDDVAALDGAENLAAPLDVDRTLGFSYGTYQRFCTHDTSRVYKEPTSWNHSDEPNINIQFLEGMFTLLGAALVRHSVYKEVGPFKEEILRSQDLEMAIRLSRKAKSVYVPKTIFFYREHEGARGPMRDRFAPQSSVKKWLVYEQKILAQVRQEFSLDEFTPTFALKWDPSLARRAALLQRAFVFAKYSLWDEAISDLQEAQAASSAPPTPQEIKIAERVVKYLPPWEALCNNPAWLASIHEYQKMSFGKDIIFAASRALYGQAGYWLKSGNFLEGTQAFKILLKLLGISGIKRRIAASLLN